MPVRVFFLLAGFSAALLARRAVAATCLLSAALALASLAPAQNLEAWYREGMAHLQAGRTSQAQASFLNVLAEVPDHFRSMTGLARLYLDTAPHKALDYANQAARLAPGYETAHLMRGQALERLGREEEAAEAYRQVIRIDPRHYDANNRLRALLRRMQERRSQVQRASERFWAEPNLRTLTLFGQILLQQAKPEEAVAELEAIRAKHKQLPEVNLWLARARRAVGDVDGEQEAYRRYLAVRDSVGVRLIMAERLEAIGRYRSAMEVIAPIEADRQALAGLDQADRARLAFLRSRSLLTRRQFAAVGAQLVEAGRLGYDPGRITAAFQEDLSLFDGQAALWRSFADWHRLRSNTGQAAAAEAQACHADRAACGEARRALEAMRGGGKAPPDVWLALGDVALAEGKPGEALALLQRVEAGHDAYRRAQLLIGLIHRAQGDTTRAVDALMRYVFLFPDRNGMLYARGMLFWEMGERDVAVAVWKEHPAVLAEHPDLLARLALHLQGKSDPAAEQVFREELAKVQPQLALNHLRLGDLYQAQGRYEDAVRAWKAALGQRPRDSTLMLHTARAYLAQGKTAEAATLLRQAWQLGNLPPDLAVELAQQLVKGGQPGEALTVYLQVHQDAPSHPAAREAIPELALIQGMSADVRRAAAAIALETGRPKLAERLLVVALTERPADPDVRQSLADYYLRQGQPDVAERVLRGDFRVSPAGRPGSPAAAALTPLTPTAPVAAGAASESPPQPVAPAASPPQPAPAIRPPAQPAPAPAAVLLLPGAKSPTPAELEAILNHEFVLRRDPNAARGEEGP